MPSKPEKRRSKQAQREVVHAKPRTQLCVGAKAMSADMAKKLLGWEEESDERWGSDFLLKDNNGNKIRCGNNVTNRPLYGNLLATYEQEILRKNWRLNGEPIIIGKTGLVLNGQHQMISLVLAVQAWENDPDKWGPYWKESPKIDKLIVYGIDENDHVVNTMDTCKPRSLGDVIYRSHYFADLPAKDRKAVARVCDYGIRTLWDRTGAALDAYAPRRTHAESLDFLERHPGLLECVNHIHTEDADSRITKYVSPGIAAGLLYLMATCESDQDAYVAEGNEKPLDWSAWEQACDFWVSLAAGDQKFQGLRKYLANLFEEGKISMREKVALIVKAWLAYRANKPMMEKHIGLHYVENAEGVPQLAEHPTCGGIDLARTLEVDEELIEEEDPAEEEIEERAKKTRRNRLVTSQADPEQWQSGDTAWVMEQGSVDPPFFAQLTSDPYDTDTGEMVAVRDNAESLWEVKVSALYKDRPENPAEVAEVEVEE